MRTVIPNSCTKKHLSQAHFPVHKLNIKEVFLMHALKVGPDFNIRLALSFNQGAIQEALQNVMPMESAQAIMEELSEHPISRTY